MAYNRILSSTVSTIVIVLGALSTVCNTTVDIPQLEGLDTGIEIQEDLHTPIIAIKKSHILVNCSVIPSKRHEPVTYYWKKDGVRIRLPKSRAPRIEVLQNGSLLIRRVKHGGKGHLRTDEGFYECFAKNDVGIVIGRRVHVKVTRIAKKFTESPESQSVGVGGVAFLACQISAVPETLYVWQKNNEPFSTDHKRFRILKDSKSLIISDVEATDTGTYKCFAANKALLRVDASPSQLRWRDTNQVILNITKETTHIPLKVWRKPQQNLNITSNQSTILDCIVAGQPKPHVIWTWNGKDLPKRSEILVDGSLALSSVTIKMAGIYKCMAKIPDYQFEYTSVGETNLIVESSVRSIPVITRGPTSSAHKIAKHFILNCETSGFPKPTVTWLKNGEVVKPDGRHEILEDKKSFRIFNSGEKDSGYYQCLAENSEGWTTALARLKIDQNVRAPQPPKRVFGEGISESEVLVNWTLEDSETDLPILGFTVHYRQGMTKDSEYREDNFLVKPPSQFTSLTHLKPDTNYIIYVKSYNRYGASIDSTPIIVKTHGSVPLSFPSPTITSQDNRAILVEWDPLDPEQSQGKITDYQIFYGKTSDQNFQVLKIPGDRSNYLIKDLEAGANYQLRMLAGTESGFPTFDDEEWPWIYHRFPTSPDHHNSIFPSVNITVLNSTTAHVTWQYNGPVDLIEQIIFLRDLKNMASAEVFNYQPTSRRITLTNLAQDSFHEFYLVVKSKSLSTGSVSKLFHTSTSKQKQSVSKVPRPNIHILASLMQPDQITVTWSSPGNDDILYYKLRCETVFGLNNKCDSKNKVRYIKTHSNSAIISGLDAYTWYNISVKPELQNGQGIYSLPSLILTREDIPSRPEHVMARVVSPDEVILEWSRPLNPNGVIKGHYISYSNHQYHPDTWPQVFQEGMMNTANISNLTKPLYYFLIRACTLAGQGKPSNIIKVFMKHERAGLLSDQHLGIIGGASIGITCILLTVCIIFIKQRQLKKRCIAAQRANSIVCPHGCTSTSSKLPPQVSTQPPIDNHVCRSEELWSLLTPSDKGTVESPSPDSSNGTQETTTATASDLYCHVTSC